MQSCRLSAERQRPGSWKCTQPNNDVAPRLEPWENPVYFQCVGSELCVDQQLLDESEQAVATGPVQSTSQIGGEPRSEPRERGCAEATSTESESDEGGGVDSGIEGPVVESEGSRAQVNLAVTSGYSEVPPSHLAVTVLRATGLRAKAFQGGSNPYAILQLGQRRITTPVIHDTLTPPLELWVVLNSEPRKKPKKRGHVEGCTEILAAFHPTANLSPRPTPNPAPFSPTSQASPNPPTFPPTPNPSPSLTPNPTSNPPPSARRATSAGRVTHTSPPSVQPVVKHWEPIHPSCGEENSGVLDSIPPPSAPASPQESADSPDCVTTADFSNTIRLVSYSPAFIVTCETGDLEDGPASIIICETGNLEDGPASIIICETGNLEDGPASIIIVRLETWRMVLHP
ncbi:uncharacterized protein [Salmo salar]|uniref:C2 domain-containing protein n=1 Tax=Salmo salar TaxID=8030 RepID=A0ABM3EWA5_SALSA|nr:uncharacterized protein LOC106604206 [Salmo salar]